MGGDAGKGVYGVATSATGTTYGGYFQDASSAGYAGYFTNTGGGYGIYSTGARNVLDGTFELAGDISPAQLTANQNDYSPSGLSTATVLRLTSDASRIITSLAGGSDGRVVTIMNVGSNPIVLKNDDGATGTAANRFALTGDLTLAAKQSAMLMYDTTAQRWRQVSNGTATGSGDNLGNHTATANIQLGSNWLSGDGGNEGVFVDASGNVGIGTNGPQAKLQIDYSDSSTVFDTQSSEIFRLKNTNTTNNNWINLRFTTNDVAAAQVTSAMIANQITSHATSAVSGDLVFATRNAGTLAEKMRITGGGKVGIGALSPAANLHVYSPSGPAVIVAGPGTGTSEQAVINLLTKSNGSDTLGDATSKGWQIWSTADGSTAFTGIGGPNTFGIGYANGAGWPDPAIEILPTGYIGVGMKAGVTTPGAWLDAGRSFALSGDLTPSQITANQNDYNPSSLSEASVLRLNSNASRNITGLQGGVDGRVLTVFNIGSNPIVLKNQSTSSVAGNRFALGTDVTLTTDQGISLIYDSTSQRWRSAASLPFSAPTAGCTAMRFPQFRRSPPARSPRRPSFRSPLIPAQRPSRFQGTPAPNFAPVPTLRAPRLSTTGVHRANQSALASIFRLV